MMSLALVLTLVPRVSPALLLVLVVWVLPVAAEGDLSKQRHLKAPISKSSSKDLQFMGLVEPGQRMSIVLMPGENVRELLVKAGEMVKEGDVAAKLSNDQLVSGFADLQQRKRTLQEGKQQVQLLKLELDLKERQLTKINEEIAREEKLTETIPGYSSSVSSQLESQQMQLTGQLTVLKAKYDMAGQNQQSNRALAKLIDDQITEVSKRIEALVVRSPFDGRVKYVFPDPNRIIPGAMLFEIWDESFLMVRGSIIQHQFDLIKPGDTVRVSIDFVQAREVTGVVESVGQSVHQSANRSSEKRAIKGYSSFQVMIKITDDQALIQPGMMVSILKKDLDNRADR